MPTASPAPCHPWGRSREEHGDPRLGSACGAFPQSCGVALGLSSWQMSLRHWHTLWASPGVGRTGEGWRSVCLCVLPMTGTRLPGQHPGPLSVEAAGRAEERQALGWGHAHALFPGLEGWLRLEYSDTSSPGDLGWWKSCPTPAWAQGPPGLHGAHRLLRATLKPAWGLPSWARRLPGLGWGRSGPRGHQTQACRAPCLQVGLGPPFLAPSRSA